MSNQEEHSGKEGKKTTLIIIVLVAALVVCVGFILLRPSAPKAEESESTRSAALDRGFVQEAEADNIMSDMADRVEEGMFECKMTTTWTFDTADSESPNSYVANVENNRNTIYFDVYENGSDELLYASPMIPVGSEIRNIKLEKQLPAGDHDAVVMYTLVDENYEEVSRVGFNITISIAH